MAAYDMAMMQNQAATQNALAGLVMGQNASIGALKDAYQTGRGDVNAAVPQQTGALQTGYGTATGSIAQGRDQSLSALGQGYNTASGALGGAYDTARGDISGGVSAYDPYYQTGTAANTAYANAVGLNGQAGYDAARGAFQASPGYEWMVNQASDAAMRKANAGGMLASGNTLDALTRLGSNLANQEYQNYLNRLQGLGQQGMTAAGARMEGGRNMATLASQYGQNQAGLATDLSKNQANAYDAYGTRGADLATGLGTNLSNVYGNQGSQLSSLAQNYGTNQAGVYTGLAAKAADVTMQGASNMNNLYGQQAQLDYAKQQAPWMLAGGALGGLANVGAGLASNPRLF
jgi:hypothetical protein